MDKTMSELWEIKVSSDYCKIFARGQRDIFCWIHEKESNEYQIKYHKTVYEDEDILDWDLAEKNNLIICSVNYKTLVFLDIETGDEKKVNRDTHKDIITRIYAFKKKESFLTGSIDGTIVVRKIENTDEKEGEIKTNRVVNLVVTYNEEMGFSLDGDRKSVTKFNLNNYTTCPFVIEKD